MPDEKEPQKEEKPAPFKSKLLPNQWKEVKQRYENGETLPSIAQDFPISTVAIHKTAVKRGWRNPRKASLDAARTKARRQIKLDSQELAKALKDVLAARRTSSGAAMRLIKQFDRDVRSGEIKLKTVNELKQAVELVERAAGIDRQNEGQHTAAQSAQNIYNVQMLSGRGPQPTLIDVPAENPLPSPGEGQNGRNGGA